MKFPFVDFWSKLIVKFGDSSYKALLGTIFKNRSLRVEREDNDRIKLPGVITLE
jgi:hypothetical protein